MIFSDKAPTPMTWGDFQPSHSVMMENLCVIAKTSSYLEAILTSIVVQIVAHGRCFTGEILALHQLDDRSIEPVSVWVRMATILHGMCTGIVIDSSCH